MPESMLIGELCRQAGCTPRTVRHYEAEGLIAPVDLTRSGRKVYGSHSVAVIQVVRLLQRLGYSLKDIRSILELTESGDTRQRRLSRRLRRQLSDCLASIDAELELLAASRKKISDLLSATETCRSCRAEDCGECGKLRKLRTLGLLEENEEQGP